jgi:hypothetical protein
MWVLVHPGQALEHSEFVHREQQFSNTLYGFVHFADLH